MGEAKRRKQLDPNFGIIPKQRNTGYEQITDSVFMSKDIDNNKDFVTALVMGGSIEYIQTQLEVIINNNNQAKQWMLGCDQPVFDNLVAAAKNICQEKDFKYTANKDTPEDLAGVVIFSPAGIPKDAICKGGYEIKI
ncbi:MULTISPECIES: hypothetical protein [unclassified Okeania]|uniref:hypothetical protein n=1 Tax=unclassified Okeania TaxID=2634635 RepID=UPI0013BFCA3D|nr:MULTISPECIES: hypothetical protein [unclassified Okeania]NEQ78087.1 hypothetical protein [Okeania sp. SIO2C9]GFZ92391.1 hypothetical protein CYANOKiyG1_02980 [Okeania sp. KiyG1]